jgi:uncharacterized protein with NRDE domain
MCTVTYIPKGNNEFIFTQNRDESPNRSAHNLIKTSLNGKEILFPKDTGAGGTWIAISDSNQLVSILNGAFSKHKHRPPYRKSRGIMALEFFDFSNAEQFLQTYHFDGMEPFTMVIYDDGKLFDFRWDGLYKFIEELDVNQTYLWASSTLYSKEAKMKRRVWFEKWKSGRIDFSQSVILDFHRTAGDGDPENDLVMNRSNLVRTTSITSIIKTSSKFEMYFSDLLSGKNLENEIDFKTIPKLD